MTSPYIAYFAGIGTVVGALAIGFAGGLVLTSPSPSQKEQATGFEKRVAAKAEKQAEPGDVPAAALSPNSTAVFALSETTTYDSPLVPAPWPSGTIQAIVQPTQEQPKAAAEPGVLQPPVRPAAPVEAVAPPSAQAVAKAREGEPVTYGVSSEWKKKDEWKKKEKKEAQRKLKRKQIEQGKPVDAEEAVAETRTTTGYAPEPPRATTGYTPEQPRHPHPLGIFNLLMGGSGN